MREGDLVANRYRIRRHAGAGAMGTVYEAFDTREGVPVALKMWRAAPDPEPRVRSRLFREAHALAEIRHPAVVRYVDHGTAPAHGPFLAMDWIAGETLADRMLAKGLRPAEGLRLISRLAGGLAAMHASGVVHRDLKPSNVMLADGDVERAVIVDFGVARVARLVDAGEERSGHLGTARYMAPEQIRNARTVDGKADVFALGCILFEALTGRPAFEGVDPVIVLARILFEPLPIPSAARAELPASIDTLVLTMLARELERRPTAEALGELLRVTESAIASTPAARLGATPTLSGREGTALELTSVESSRERPSPLSRRLVGRAGRTEVRSAPAFGGIFVGREEECRHVMALLLAGTRLVTVWGGPGIGKSRLIAEAVRRITDAGDSPWDAVVIGDLADARDADDVARILARDAGVALASPRAPEVALANALDKLGRVLLVLDPVDHIVTPLSAALVALGQGAKGVQIIAASRTRWRPPGALAIEVGPLSIAREEGRMSAAARLFVDRSGGQLSGAPAAQDLAHRAEQLVQALDGIPLAIELYAARVPVLGIDELLARAPGRAPTDATLDASEGLMARAIAASWALLSPEEQRTFAQCAVFRGGFTVEAAEKVVLPNAEAPVRDLVQSLRDKSLLSSAGSDPSDGRLTMFASLREFAWRSLKEGPDIADTLRRHAAYYAESFAPGPSGIAADAVARVEVDAENLFAAAEYSLTDEGADAATGMLALVALEPAMLARGAMGSYRALLDRAVAADARPDVLPRAAQLGLRVRQIRARLDAPRGLAQRARDDLAACLQAAEREGDAHWRASIELDLAVVFHLGRDLDHARRGYETALELLRTADDPRAEGRCIGNLGALRHDEGDFPAAAQSYRRAIELFERAGDVRQGANCLGNLAVLEQDLGQRASAFARYERAVELLETVGDARLLAITLGNFGVLEVELDRKEHALELYERSLGLLQGSGDRRSEALGRARRGALLVLLGQVDEGEADIARALDLAPPDDVLVVEAVRLQGAFVDLARSKGNLAPVKARIEHVRRATSGGGADATRSGGAERESAVESIANSAAVPSRGRSLFSRSDDIRSTVRILEAELKRCGHG